MDIKQRYRQLFQTCSSVLVEPTKFWQEERDKDSVEAIFKDYLLPLVLLVGVGIFLGEVIFSSEFFFGYAIAKAAREIISYILQYYASVYVLTELLTSFGGEKNQKAVSRLVAYSLLPFLVVSFVTGLFPGLYVVGVLGLYGIFLFFQGVKGSLSLPVENQNRYTLIGLLLFFLIFLLLNVFSWKLLQAFFGYGA